MVGIRFLLLKWKVITKQGKEARMNDVIMDQSWRCLHELSFIKIRVVTYRNIYRCMYIHGLVYTHIYTSSVS